MNATITTERTEYLRALADKFPVRDRKGRILAFYVYTPIFGDRVAGPFATNAEAKAEAHKDSNTVVCGYLLTDEGTVITESEIS